MVRGCLLYTSGGLEFASQSGQPFQLDPALSVSVDADGTVRQQGIEAGRLKVVDWADATPSAKKSGGYFQLDPRSTNALQPSTAQLRQGYQEQSNLAPAEGSVRLIEVMRQFEALNKACLLYTSSCPTVSCWPSENVATTLPPSEIPT